MGLFDWTKKTRERIERERIEQNIQKVSEGIKTLKETGRVFNQLDAGDILGKSVPDYDVDAELLRLENQHGKRILQIIAGILKEKFGLSSPEDSLPVVLVNPNINNPANFCLFKGRKIIQVKEQDSLTKGDSMGEEFAHFLRHALNPEDSHEKLTAEFFGYLGRRMLHDASDSEVQKFFFPEGVGSVKSEFKDLKALKKMYVDGKAATETKRKLVNFTGNPELKAKFDAFTKEKILPAMEGIEDTREDILVHSRGYNFASKVDMSRIHDWKKLFSMPNKEVRRRFFRPDPDYSGL
jgi:hypothetical protein